MKYLKIIVGIIIFPLLAFGQDNDWIEMCDTLTGETVYVDQVADFPDCCYEWTGTDWDKRRDEDGAIDCSDLGVCPVKQTQCKKSRSLYTVIDNTKTRFSWDMDLLITFSDGSTTVVSQTPTAGWTPQLNQWVTLFDGAMANKCDSYIVEPRCNLNNGCGGLSPPPTELLGTIPQMFWRYLQISACPTCPAIVNVEIISINNAEIDPRPLVMKFQEGKEFRYDLCQSCGTEGTLYYAGTSDEVLEQDMPLCLFECEEVFPPTPDAACAFLVNEEGCDDLGTEDDSDNVPIIRICDVCDGDIICNFYIEDNQSVVDYTIVGGFVDCDTNEPISEPTKECVATGLVKCAIVEKEKREISLCESGQWVDCETNVCIVEPEFVNCDCDVTFASYEMCCDDPLQNWIREVMIISGCPEAERIETDFDLLLNPIADVECNESPYECDNFLACETVCYTCEDFAPPIIPTINTVKPIKEQVKEVTKTLTAIKVKTAIKQSIIKDIKEGKTKEAQKKIAAAVQECPCEVGQTTTVKFCGGVAVEQDGVATTTIDTLGFTRFPCKSELKLPDENVCVVNPVTIDWGPICDTCVVGQKTTEGVNTFEPISAEETPHSYGWNSGTDDPDNPVIGCAGNYVPSISITGVNYFYDFSSIPECATINEMKIVHTGTGGGSGNVYGGYDTGGTPYPLNINGGTTTTHVWHRGGTGTCNVSANYTQIESTNEPCGTVRPTTQFTSEAIVTGITAADLSTFTVRFMAINSNDFIGCTTVEVDYSLPEGCTDENGIGYEEKKALRVGIDADCSDTLNVNVVVQQQEEITEQWVLKCDDTDNDGIGDILYYVQIVTSYLGTAQTGQTITNFEDDFLTVYTPIAPTDECAEGLLPPVDRERVCDGGNGDKAYFQNTFVINMISVLVINTELDGETLYTPVGPVVSCPDVVSTQKACVINNDQEYTGTLFIEASGDGYFESYGGQIFEKGDYFEFCCDDCVQISECYAGRIGRAASAVLTDGTVVDSQNLLGDGSVDTPNDLAETLVTLYGGSYSTSSGAEDYFCENTDLDAYIFTGLGVKIDYINYYPSGSPNTLTQLDVFSYGDCKEEPKQCTLFDYFVVRGISNELRNREWDLGPRPTSFMTVERGAAIRENFDFTAATTVDGPWLNLSVNDSNNDATVQDAQVIEGYIYVSEPIEIRFASTSAGYFALEIGECCGSTQIVIEGATQDGTVNPTSSYTLKKGPHFIRMWNIDDWSNTSRNLQWLNNGVWTQDNTPPFVYLSTEKPEQECEYGYICESEYLQLDKQTVVEFNDTILKKKIECESVAKTLVSTQQVCVGGEPQLLCVYSDKSQTLEPVQYAVENCCKDPCESRVIAEVNPAVGAGGQSDATGIKFGALPVATIQSIFDCVDGGGTVTIETNLGTAVIGSDYGTSNWNGAQTTFSIEGGLGTNTCGLVHEIFDGTFTRYTVTCYGQ